MARLRVADRECSAEPARRLGCVVLGCAGTHDRVRAVAYVADVVRVAAREQHDIAAAYVLDVRVSVDPEHKFALFDDVQAADIGETNRESPQRSVRNDPFSAQADAPEQLREQVVRLTTCVEAERGFLELTDRQSLAAIGANRLASLDDRQDIPVNRSWSLPIPLTTVDRQ